MALLFVDGMDAYSTGDNDPLVKWEDSMEGNPARWSVSTSLGRFGGGAIVVTTGTVSQPQFVKGFPTPVGDAPTTNELHVRFSFYKVGADANVRPIMVFHSPSKNYRSEVTASLWDNDGTFRLVRGNSGSSNIIANASASHSAGAWHTVEFRAVFHDSDGLFQMWLDGVEVMNVSSQDLDATTHTFSPSAGCGSLGICGTSLTSWYWDDIVIWDSTGTGTFSGTGQVGDIQIETLRPTAAGDNTGGTPSAGANYAAVDDAGWRDGDTTYVTFGASGTYDLYNIADHSLVTPSNIWAVVVNHVLRADGATQRRARSKIKTLSTEYNASDRDVEMTTTYSMIQDYWDVNPNTTGAWTIAQINALQIGIEARD